MNRWDSHYRDLYLTYDPIRNSNVQYDIDYGFYINYIPINNRQLLAYISDYYNIPAVRELNEVIAKEMSSTKNIIATLLAVNAQANSDPSIAHAIDPLLSQILSFASIPQVSFDALLKARKDISTIKVNPPKAQALVQSMSSSGGPLQQHPSKAPGQTNIPSTQNIALRIVGE
ncbi:MAG: hypothetical protein H0U75_13405 [Legionella sp.]|nr:hypothetical protein [Legionella sp.]